jgi:hypothetical protein
MKFALNESKKFLLEERFILNEAEILVEAQPTVHNLKNHLAGITTVLPKLTQQLLNSKNLKLDDNLIKLCTEVYYLITDQKKFETLVANSYEKAASKKKEESYSEEEIKILQPLFYAILSDSDGAAQNLVNIQKNRNSEQNIMVLHGHLNNLQKNIIVLYKQHKQIEKEAKTDENKTEY